MIFNLDTNNYEDIHLDITEEITQGDIPNLITEFCYGIASFFMDLASQLDCDTEQARGLKKVCLDCINNNIDCILDSNILEDDSEGSGAISQEEKDELVDCLVEANFSEDEIHSILDLVQSQGSVENATDYLKQIAKENNTDLDSDYEET